MTTAHLSTLISFPTRRSSDLESEEVLENTDETMQLWREEPDDRALVTNLQRNLHTIKGSSRMVGLDPIGSVAHVMEEILEGIAAGLHQPTEERIDALEAGCEDRKSTRLNSSHVALS